MNQIYTDAMEERLREMNGLRPLGQKSLLRDPVGTAAMSRHATGSAQAVPSHRAHERMCLDAASATPKDGAR